MTTSLPPGNPSPEADVSPLSFYTFFFFSVTAQVPFSQGWSGRCSHSDFLFPSSSLGSYRRLQWKLGVGGSGRALGSHRLNTSLNFCKPVSLFINGTNHFSCYGQVSQCNFSLLGKRFLDISTLIWGNC